MVEVVIDQKSYEIDGGVNLLEAALSLGLDLPYFCWHKALGSVGSCRQCAVQHFANENDATGRTVMACMTPVAAGMRVAIDHPICTKFRKHVIEWMMMNHPHDCPICDEGGECHLQDMTVMTGHEDRRFRFLKRTFQNQNLGPFVNHEMNRCITCYRCVRFYRDVAGGSDLQAFASSGRVYFGRFEDGVLENHFSGNLVEVCPTGVFTDKVLHKRYTRKWDLETAPSVCQLCSLGCNISPGTRLGELRRIQNRFNDEVNGYFICDLGRFGHEFVNAPERLKKPRMRHLGKPIEATFEQAFEEVKSLLQKNTRIIGIGSGRASLEANWMLKHLVREDNFFDGLLERQSVTLSEAVACMKSHAITPASLKDIREADAVVILGEDVAQTAPMIVLSIRQAIHGLRQKDSKEKLHIPPWNDAAVRDFSDAVKFPLFLALPLKTELSSLAEAHCLSGPADLAKLAQALKESLRGEADLHVLSDQESAWVRQTRDGLLKAKNPVVIAGASLAEPSLIQLAAEITQLLQKSAEKNARLCLVLGQANSLGLGLLEPRPMAEALTRIDQQLVDVAIVLENDLNFSLGKTRFLEICEKVPHLIVIDSLENETTKQAFMALPCASFAESTGTMVNNEGRLQRFFSVFVDRLNPLESSWRVMVHCMGSEALHKWQKNDDVCASFASDLSLSSHALERLYEANFRIDDMKIPRQTTEFSGRTAMDADITIHEPKPPKDVDSPLAYSMEGAHKKIPLPLVSFSWEPRWNSVQSGLRLELEDLRQKKELTGGVRLFEAHPNGLWPKAEHALPKIKTPFPKFTILPRYLVFGSEERSGYCASMKEVIKEPLGLIAVEDALKLGLNANFSSKLALILGDQVFHVPIEAVSHMASGLLFLPYGMVDAGLFYRTGILQMPKEGSV